MAHGVKGQLTLVTLHICRFRSLNNATFHICNFHIVPKNKLENGTTEWFPVTKGGRQGCILSPHLFSLYTEGILREVEYDPRSGEYDEPRMQGLSIRDLRYADGTAPLATTAGLENLIKSVKEHSEQKGLLLNVKKTKIMSTDRCREEAVINIDREEIERVKLITVQLLR